MSVSPRQFLRSLERNPDTLRGIVRWDRGEAAKVVPTLADLLEHHDAAIRQRALDALFRIGPNAQSALPRVIPLLDSPDRRVYCNAALTVAGLSLKKPGPAVAPLVRMAATDDPERLKYALFALTELGEHARVKLGRDAAPAIAAFIATLAHRDARLRRLALRGLWSMRPVPDVLLPLLKRFQRDSNKEVREYATKLVGRLGDVEKPVGSRATRKKSRRR